MKNKKGKLLNFEPIKIEITASEKEALSVIDKQAAQMKMQIADLTVAQQNLTLNIAEAVQKYKTLNNEFLSQLHLIGKNHGLDLTDPSKGTWQFDGASFIKNH